MCQQTSYLHLPLSPFICSQALMAVFASLVAEVASGVLVIFVSDFGSPFFACLPVGSWLSLCVDNLFSIFSHSSPACCGPGQRILFLIHLSNQFSSCLSPHCCLVLGGLGLGTLALMCLSPPLFVSLLSIAREDLALIHLFPTCFPCVCPVFACFLVGWNSKHLLRQKG